ncbi:hypothetical protein INR76_01820 [Marixanthomonas sp. SCSIO 43207]|uniref:DUF6252 family protein n=1 Tax=Marixanthomonas sp. SCSIO 43207 TaxID=2779360 RepID=UPI001CA7DFD2|nr:DUF6252 family protein [Marixanthomonas sp. SCSIO 43207]UAB81523.1 hypothetical protein INR76_01820 [Marixanthomonas sp. SCSIO 43207]
MKTLKTLSLILFVSLSLFACKSDDDGGDGGSAAEGLVTAKVNGNNFKSMRAASTAVKTQANGITTLRAQGSDSNGKGVVLTIVGYDGTGSYNVGGGANIFVNAVYVEADVNNPTNSQTWQAPFDDTVAGSVSVSEDTNDGVKGTFTFEAKNGNDDSMVNITEGSFNLKYQ